MSETHKACQSNEPEGVNGDYNLAVCQVSLLQILCTKIGVLANSRTKIHKGIGRTGIFKSQGLARYPVKVEEKVATILAQIMKDKDMPKERKY